MALTVSIDSVAGVGKSSMGTFENAASLPFDCALAGEQRTIVENLWRDGFAAISGLFTAEEMRTLQTECARLMKVQPREPWTERAKYGSQYRLPIFCDLDWSVLSNTAGLSPVADVLLERLFSSPDFEPILRAILGVGYKIWEIGIRRSERTDSGLRLHQDAKGEFGLCIFLDDVSGPEGTTVFLPGSHRYPVGAPQTGINHLHPRYLRRWVKPATGRAGDIILFCKSVWHGRLPATNAVENDAILMSFFAAGYDYPAFDVPADVLREIPAGLAKMLDPELDTKALPTGRRLILSPAGQLPRLIDELYKGDSRRVHPAQLARVFPPLISAARKLKHMIKRSPGVVR